MISEKIPGLIKSNKFILFKSANGKTDRENMSKPVSIKESDTAKAIKAPVVISPQCPTNLLERDLLKKLNIEVVPPQNGMRAHRSEDSDVYFDETAKPVYYSPDLFPHLKAHKLEDADVYFDETAKP